MIFGKDNQKDAETVKFGAYTTACHFSPVDHAAIAKAGGCRSTRIDDAADLAGALKHAVGASKPWLIEVMTDPNAFPAIALYENYVPDAARAEAGGR